MAAKKRPSGPSGDAKTYQERSETARRVEVWVPLDVWAQFEDLAREAGTRRLAVIEAIRLAHSRLPKKK